MSSEAHLLKDGRGGGERAEGFGVDQLYPEEGDQPSNVHLARALGGPLANFLVALAALLAWSAGRRSRLLGYLAGLNLAFAVASMAPIPTMDGGVVLRELRHRRAPE